MKQHFQQFQEMEKPLSCIGLTHHNPHIDLQSLNDWFVPAVQETDIALVVRNNPNVNPDP